MEASDLMRAWLRGEAVRLEKAADKATLRAFRLRAEAERFRAAADLGAE